MRRRLMLDQRDERGRGLGSSWWLGVAATVACVLVTPAARADFSLVYAFSGTDGAAIPYGSVIHHDGWLYGSTSYTTNTGSRPTSIGSGGGVVYAVRPDGTGFRIVKSFATATDGQNPFQGLTVSGSSLYGVTRNGGQNGRGVLFKVGTQGDGFTLLHQFGAGTDGANPYAAPILVGDKLYGMTFIGGTAAGGVIYGYDLATGGYSVLHDFATVGSKPFGTLTQVGEWLYGLVSDHRDTANHGAIFRFRPADGSYEVVHAFEGGSAGGYPYDSLTWDGDRHLYGTTLGYYPFTGETAPLADQGVVFRFDIVAGTYEVIHDFAAQNGDGAKPNSSMLVAPDGRLYGISHGTEAWGGPGYEFGTLYRMNPDGSDFAVLHTFDSMADGNTPMRGLLLLGDDLYGTTAFGGVGTKLGNGTVWTFALPEPTGLLPLGASLGLIGLVRRRRPGRVSWRVKR